ncbi:zinc-ribbon domain containing protein [Thermodesulfobacteriota bacterium]
MESIIITCIQCDTEFEFTGEEQEKIQRRGFDPPLRCSICRKNKSRDSEGEKIKKFKDKKRQHRHKHVEPFYY